jgi:hypothetical protein
MKRLVLTTLLFLSCTGQWARIQAPDGQEYIGRVIEMGDSLYFFQPDTTDAPVDTAAVVVSGRTIHWRPAGTWHKVYVGDPKNQYILNYTGTGYPDPGVRDTVWTWRKFFFCQIVRGDTFYTIPEYLLPNGDNSLHYDPLIDNRVYLPDSVVVAVTALVMHRYLGWVESDWSESVIVKLK